MGWRLNPGGEHLGAVSTAAGGYEWLLMALSGRRHLAATILIVADRTGTPYDKAAIDVL